jgi:hypothetical protein
MMIYLPTYQLPREVNLTGSRKLLILLNKFDLLTELPVYHGKLILACKSLILLLLTNLPNFPPYRGYRGVVSNPPPPTLFNVTTRSENVCQK